MSGPNISMVSKLYAFLSPWVCLLLTSRAVFRHVANYDVAATHTVRVFYLTYSILIILLSSELPFIFLGLTLNDKEQARKGFN